jgi:hypothetical protein
MLQTLVSLTLTRGEVPVMLALRLFLPESWTSKRARLERAGVPAEYRTARTKPEMALTEIDRAIAAGVRFGCVLADAGSVTAAQAVPQLPTSAEAGRSAAMRTFGLMHVRWTHAAYLVRRPMRLLLGGQILSQSHHCLQKVPVAC